MIFSGRRDRWDPNENIRIRSVMSIGFLRSRTQISRRDHPTYYTRLGEELYATESGKKRAGGEFLAYVGLARRSETLLRLAGVRRKKVLTITTPRLYRWGRPTQINRARKPLRQ